MKKKSAIPANAVKRASHDGGESGGILLVLQYASIVVACYFLYWRCIAYPFIQDDWVLLYSIVFRGAGHFAAQALNPFQGMFFRPLGQLVFLGLYEIFHLDSSAFHIAGLLIHSANACLVILVMRRLGGTAFAAWCAGMLYMCAALVHVDPLFWAVGLYDILGAFFFLASLYYYLCGKNLRSVAFFFAAVLTKEATLVLPLILVLYDVLLRSDTPGTLRLKLQGRAGSLWPFLVIVVIVGGVELAHHLTLAQASVGGDYTVSLLGVHVLTNLANYSVWCFDALFANELFPGMRLGLGGALVVVSIALQIKVWKSHSRISLFFLGWYFAALLPVLFLTHHAFRYYATYALPAFLGWLLLPILSVRFARTSYVPYVIVLLLAFDLNSGSQYVRQLDDNGPDLGALEGSNGPTRKGSLEKLAQDFMLLNWPSMPESTLIVMQGFNTASLGVNAAPCVWYHDPTLRVLEPYFVKKDSLGYFYDDSTHNVKLEDSPGGVGKRVPVPDAAHVLAVRYSNRELKIAAVKFVK